jgi:hypothetical protein
MLTFKADVGLKLTEWLLPAHSIDRYYITKLIGFFV